MKWFLIRFAAAALAAFFIAGSALAQNVGAITNHSFAIGKGAGVQGFTSLLCGSAQLAVGQAAADPICQTITGDVTITAGGVTAIGAGKVTNSMIAAMTSAQLAAIISNETGSGLLVFGTSPTLTTPILGVATATSINAVTIAAGNISGETSTGSATAGNIGEYISASIAVGSPTALTTATPINLTSISLTAGDWDVYFEPSFLFVASTSYTQLTASISLTSATTDNSSGEFFGMMSSAANVPGAATNISVRVGPRRVSVSGTTTVFGVLNQAFTVSTLSAWGTLRARRVR